MVPDELKVPKYETDARWFSGTNEASPLIWNLLYQGLVRIWKMSVLGHQDSSLHIKYQDHGHMTFASLPILLILPADQAKLRK